MPRELPPTSSLRAFSRAARALSFKRAAEELHVSPSALSRQIQALEEHLGVALFERRHPGLALTEEGRSYLAAVDAALAQLESAQDRFGARRRPLRVSALESFSESWLIPNLRDFEAAHPDVEIELEATLRYADFARDAIDVAIRFGTGPWDGLHSEPILDLDFFPVCSPALAAGDPALRRPADLASHALIHVAQTPDAWAQWLRAAGVSFEPRRQVTYDHVSIALSAAESGQGVAISTAILCAQRIAAKRLCRPFRETARSEATYHFVCRPESLEVPRITALRDWLVDRLARVDAPPATADAI
ncbi:MAG TPA: transcriptional regulator GcvA [Myxococcota bacterium]|nr:transcriptional regulator GcvA [Myxococcota bacterium]